MIAGSCPWLALDICTPVYAMPSFSFPACCLSLILTPRTCPYTSLSASFSNA